MTKADVTKYHTKHRRRYRGTPRRKARRAIRRRLIAKRQQRAVDRFIQDFRPRYRALTLCAEGYAVAECGGTSPSTAPAQGR